MNNNLFYTIYSIFFNINLKRKQINENSLIDLKLKNPTHHLIGVFDIKLKLWYNGWALEGYQNTIQLAKSKELLNYIINYDNNNNNINRNVHIIVKSIVCSSKIYISEKKTQLDLIIAIFLYLSKINMFYIEINNDLVYYKAFNI